MRLTRGSNYIEETDGMDGIGTGVDGVALDAIQRRGRFTGRIHVLIASGDIDAQFRHWLGVDGKTTTVNAEEERVTCLVKVETIVAVRSCAESEIAVQTDVDPIVLFLQ